MHKRDTLVVTPTLGHRSSLRRTVVKVREIGGDRIHHRLVCPPESARAIEKMELGCEIVSVKAPGIYPALNKGFGMNSEDFQIFAFINDDDYWLPGFNRLLSELRSSHELSAVYGTLMSNDVDEIALVERPTCSIASLFPYLLARGIVPFSQQSVAFKREIFTSLAGFDCDFKLAADTDFWCRAISNGHVFKYIRVPAAVYTRTGMRLSSDKLLQSEEMRAVIVKNNLRSDWITLFASALFRIVNSSLYVKRLIRRKVSFRDS